MRNTNLLLASDLPVTDTVSVHIPTVGEILNFGEDAYYGMARGLSNMPYDAQVWLDDMGIDYQEISEFDLFYLVLYGYREKDLSPVFGAADFSSIQYGRTADGSPVIFEPSQKIVIDEMTQREISDAIRLLHGWRRTEKTAGNKESKEYTLKKLRKQQERAQKRGESKYLESMVTAMVNCHDFKYDFSSVQNLSIYCFNQSAGQILHSRSAGYLLQAVYNGKIDSSQLDEKTMAFIKPADDR